MIKTTYVVQIDSDNRLSGSHTNFYHKIELPHEHFDRVAVLSASIPKTFYLVQDGSNTLTLTESATSATITMTPANYNTRSFASILESKLSTQSPNGWTYTIAMPVEATEPSTGKYTITVSGNSSQPSISFSSDSSLYRQLGFEPNSTNAFSANTLTSTHVVDFELASAVLITSNLTNTKGSTLQEIFVDNSFEYSRIGFQNTCMPYNAKELTSASLSSVHFSLTDTDGFLLNTNGHPINISLVFFQHNPFYELASKDLIVKNAVAQMPENNSNWA